MTSRYEWVLTMPDSAMKPEEVKAARDALGMSQGDFAEAVGASHRQHVSRAERETGLRGCQAKVVRLLLDAAGEG